MQKDTSASPIEKAFWEEWISRAGNSQPYRLVPQYQVGRYRVDFAHVESQTAIELDGHATHSSPDAIAYDRKRQREIEAAGWKVIRFGGKEIFKDVGRCVDETARVLTKTLERLKEINQGGNESHYEAADRAGDIDKQYFLDHPEATEYTRPCIRDEFPPSPIPPDFTLVKQVKPGMRCRIPIYKDDPQHEAIMLVNYEKAIKIMAETDKRMQKKPETQKKKKAVRKQVSHSRKQNRKR